MWKGELYMIKFKEKTREELIAGFKRAIERKREFEEQAQKEFADMRRRGADWKASLLFWRCGNAGRWSGNFAAIIVQKSNPKLNEIVEAFNRVVNILKEKPE